LPEYTKLKGITKEAEYGLYKISLTLSREKSYCVEHSKKYHYWITIIILYQLKIIVESDPSNIFTRPPKYCIAVEKYVIKPM